MPTIEQNLGKWTVGYDWSRAGDEWSDAWGGTEMLWWNVLLPRIHAFLPAGTILEIAPGYGRITQYLKDFCQRLILVDLAPDCIEACRARFAASSTPITYHVNDGRSLEMIADGSLDFVFSFDSLVHAEADVIDGYLQQLARKLAPDGVGFLHHSTIKDALPGEGDVVEPEIAYVRTLWRSESMSAALFREMCERAGLACISQEVINWGTNLPLPIDCLSTFTRADGRLARPTRIVYNGRFMQQARYLANLAPLYTSPA